jgi:hypothetical protein
MNRTLFQPVRAGSETREELVYGGVVWRLPNRLPTFGLV